MLWTSQFVKCVVSCIILMLSQTVHLKPATELHSDAVNKIRNWTKFIVVHSAGVETVLVVDFCFSVSTFYYFSSTLDLTVEASATVASYKHRHSVLLQFEVATGRFPYTQWTTVFQQICEVVHSDPPRLPPGEFSPDLQDFVGRW